MSTLAFALAATIKHDGHGGVADLLATPAEAVVWLEQHQDQFAGVLGRPLEVGGAEAHEELVRIRRAVRALFARAVAPGAPSRADAHRLMDADAALQMINQAAGLLGTQKLVWEEGAEPTVEWAGGTADLAGAVGRSAIEFLTGPDRGRLRACPAARCVKYFLQEDPRQLWCSASCGNRERVNRHYRKRHSG
ncbi:CGNR zinc finger domain-containing protein [Kribbella sp. NPDC058693]|uniref:CGNR zinc finger domain-containing protein n=1 Tax=Kribbella sp. NPDC058693 TaxID=3346602 RepID=UPI00365981B3